MILSLDEKLSVGRESVFDSTSSILSKAVVFEDDTTTGYFYAVDLDSAQTILDALHIYNVADVIDKLVPSKLQIWWTDDGQKASLVINDICHAIFDFDGRAGYSRNGFPETGGEWCLVKDRFLTDQLVLQVSKE